MGPLNWVPCENNPRLHYMYIYIYILIILIIITLIIILLIIIIVVIVRIIIIIGPIDLFFQGKGPMVRNLRSNPTLASFMRRCTASSLTEIFAS